MTICFSVDEQGNIMGPTNSNLVVGDMMCDVGIAFQHDAIGFFCDLDGDGVPERILNGTWTYKGQMLIIVIQEEVIWGGQFTELVFLPIDK